MVSAHGAPAAGGANVEMLVIAGAVLLLGIVLFAQKTARPAVGLTLAVVGVGLGLGAFAAGGDSAGVAISIVRPSDGATVPAGDAVPLTVHVDGATVGDASAGSGDAHIHVFVDDRIVSMPTTLEPTVRLEPGRHTITVELTDADHVQFDPRVLDSVEVVAE